MKNGCISEVKSERWTASIVCQYDENKRSNFVTMAESPIEFMVGMKETMMVQHCYANGWSVTEVSAWSKP